MMSTMYNDKKKRIGNLISMWERNYENIFLIIFVGDPCV